MHFITSLHSNNPCTHKFHSLACHYVWLFSLLALFCQFQWNRVSSPAKVSVCRVFHHPETQVFFRKTIAHSGWKPLWYSPQYFYSPLDICDFFSGLSKDSVSQILFFQATLHSKVHQGNLGIFLVQPNTHQFFEWTIANQSPLLISSVVRSKGIVLLTSPYQN